MPAFAGPAPLEVSGRGRRSQALPSPAIAESRSQAGGLFPAWNAAWLLVALVSQGPRRYPASTMMKLRSTSQGVATALLASDPSRGRLHDIRSPTRTRARRGAHLTSGMA